MEWDFAIYSIKSRISFKIFCGSPNNFFVGALATYPPCITCLAMARTPPFYLELLQISGIGLRFIGIKDVYCLVKTENPGVP
jgi:hypothetical protein